MVQCSKEKYKSTWSYSILRLTLKCDKSGLCLVNENDFQSLRLITATSSFHLSNGMIQNQLNLKQLKFCIIPAVLFEKERIIDQNISHLNIVLGSNNISPKHLAKKIILKKC